MATDCITVLIYEEDAKLINQWTLQYPNIETGGDLFGLWQNESEVVVQLAIGPGENCRRTQTAFFQDERYLGNVGSFLTSTEGLCNIGEWHSHHSLNLPVPSHGDKETVWRHLPTYKLDRFLLFIATISNENGLPGIHSFMFTPPENASRQGNMFSTKFEILPGQNPFRAQREIMEALLQGAEVQGTGVDSCAGWTNKKNKKESKKERKRRENDERKREKKERKKKKEEEKAMTNETEVKKKKKIMRSFFPKRRCSSSRVRIIPKESGAHDSYRKSSVENKLQDSSSVWSRTSDREGQQQMVNTPGNWTSEHEGQQQRVNSPGNWTSEREGQQQRVNSPGNNSVRSSTVNNTRQMATNMQYCSYI